MIEEETFVVDGHCGYCGELVDEEPHFIRMPPNPPVAYHQRCAKIVLKMIKASGHAEVNS